MTTRTVHYELVEVRLGTDLARFVLDRRGDGRSWRLIARDLETATGIDITGETLRGWFLQDAQSTAAHS